MSDQADSKDSWRELYPFSPNFVDTDAGKMHYIDVGAGEPVVMLHGNPTWSFMYRDLVQGLRHRHRVIVPDHIGCGLSDKPQDWSYHLRDHVSNLDRLLGQHLGLESCTLVLHDWGGAIGMGYAVRHPGAIRRLVVMNTAAFLMDQCPWRIRLCRLPVFGSLAIRGCNAFARAATHMAVAGGRQLTGAVKEGFIHPYRTWHDRIATQRFVQDIPLSPRHPTWDELAYIQRNLHLLEDVPMLICWGAQDFCFHDAFLTMWRQYFPDAQVHRFEHAGHYLLEDAGEDVLALMKTFLGDDES